MEIKDNTFSRQFETFLDGKLISLEYSFQEKKIFYRQTVSDQVHHFINCDVADLHPSVCSHSFCPLRSATLF